MQLAKVVGVMTDPRMYAEIAIHWAISFVAGLIILLLQVNLLKKRPLLKLADRPSSFLELDALVSERRFRTIAGLIACPISVLVFLLAAEASPFVEQAKAFLIPYLADLAGDKYKAAATDLMRAIPDYLSPLFVLMAAALSFAPYVRKPLEMVRNFIVPATGIESRADKAGLEAARLALKRFGDREAEEKLEDQFGVDAPLPPELIHSDDETKLAYQILFFSSEYTPKIGLERAIAQTLGRIRVYETVSVDNPIPSGASTVLVGAALVVYLALCIAYVLLVPLAAPWFRAGPANGGFFFVEWPLAQFRGILALTLAQQTLAFVVPFALGMWLYPSRRHQFGGETVLQSFAVVFGILFLFASLVNFLFDALFVARRSIGELSHDLISFEDVKIWADVFIPAIVPAMALAIWIWCKDFRTRWLSYAILCLASAMLLNVCQLAYECVSGEIRGYFWHQSVLGFFLMLSFFLSSNIASERATPLGDRKPLSLLQGAKPVEG